MTRLIQVVGLCEAFTFPVTNPTVSPLQGMSRRTSETLLVNRPDLISGRVFTPFGCLEVRCRWRFIFVVATTISLLPFVEAAASCLAVKVPTLIQLLEPWWFQKAIGADEHLMLRTELEKLVRPGTPHPWLLIENSSSPIRTVIVFGHDLPSEVESSTAQRILRFTDNRQINGAKIMKCSHPFSLSRAIALLAHQAGGPIEKIITSDEGSRHMVKLGAIQIKRSAATLASLQHPGASVRLQMNGGSWEGSATRDEWASVVRIPISRWVARTDACEELEALRLDPKLTHFWPDSQKVCDFDRDETKSENCDVERAVEWMSALEKHVPGHCSQGQPRFIVHGFADGFFERCDRRSAVPCESQRELHNQGLAARRAEWVTQQLREKVPWMRDRISSAAEVTRQGQWSDQHKWDSGLAAEYCKRPEEDKEGWCRIARVTVSM